MDGDGAGAGDAGPARGAVGYSPPRSPARERTFWPGQPVEHSGDSSGGDGEEGGRLAEPSSFAGASPALPAGLEWAALRADTAAGLAELEAFLGEHYGGGGWVTAPPAAALRWMLGRPGADPRLLLGVRARGDGRLVACVAGHRVGVRLRGGRRIEAVEVNLLCVDRARRGRCTAPLLVRELSHRAALGGAEYAVYCAAPRLSRPVATARYWHLPLRPRRLAEAGFASPGHGETLEAWAAPYERAREARRARGRGAGFARVDTEAAAARAAALLDEGARRADGLAAAWDAPLAAHALLPRAGVCESSLGGAGVVGVRVSRLRAEGGGAEVLAGVVHLAAVAGGGGGGGEAAAVALHDEAARLAERLGCDLLSVLDAGCMTGAARAGGAAEAGEELHFYVFNRRCASVRDPRNLELHFW